MTNPSRSVFLKRSGNFMRILCVNSVISRFGGVEFSAMGLADELVARGHEVHFLAAAGVTPRLLPTGKEEATSEGILHHYRKFPRIYPLGERHGLLRKWVWHVQDLAHPANEKQFADVLAKTAPEAIILHNITAIGMNIWRTIAKRGTPCIQVLHDFGVVCKNMSMYRNGQHCDGLCHPCNIQKKYRFSMIRGAKNIGFVCPAKATLETIETHVDLTPWKRQVIPNANRFLTKPRIADTTPIPEILFVGRLDIIKGADVMLKAAELAAGREDFLLNLLGTGSEYELLRRRYAGKKWVQFHGSVDQNAIADFMSRARFMLLPSLWFENAPVVAVHALTAGLPILGSRIGGIPEHVSDNRTGRLLPTGDVGAWTNAIVDALQNPNLVERWSEGSLEAAQQFEAGEAAVAYEELLRDLAADSMSTSSSSIRPLQTNA
jgi:glycosyltransferase involved in cell wall biosynthesis